MALFTVNTQPGGSTPDIGAFELTQSFGPPENFVPTKPFDGLEYIASYPNLIQAFGPNEAAGVAHYRLHGSAEGREVSFDGLEYIASYADLIQAFGTDRDAGSTHFISSGFLEARTTSFNAFEYIATYDDLIDAFGVNQAAGSTHYLTFGRGEGRSVQFDGLEYIAGYPDLRAAFGADEDAGAAHFIAAGHDEERAILFDGLQYIASHTDLIRAFGTDVASGARHYILYGAAEHRSPNDFDEQQYLANYPDLQAAFGDDTEAATRHFITNCSAEGRTAAMTTFTVNTTADVVDGNYSQLSLREAVNRANSTVAGDTIVFAGALEGQTLVLAGGELVLSQDVTIDGDQKNDGTRVTVDANHTDRIIENSGGVDLSLLDLSLINGEVSHGAAGGAPANWY